MRETFKLTYKEMAIHFIAAGFIMLALRFAFIIALAISPTVEKEAKAAEPKKVAMVEWIETDQLNYPVQIEVAGYDY